jgi:hypothetical protein
VKIAPISLFQQAVAGMSVYCASKAALNMLPISPFFREVKETGSLKSAEDVAKKIVKRVLTS